MHRFIVIAFVCAVACKSGDDAKRAAAYTNHCKEDLAALKDSSADKMKHQSAVDSCGAACAKGDEASCTAMRSQVRELCAQDHAWCDAQCNGDKNFEQIKKAACAIAKP